MGEVRHVCLRMHSALAASPACVARAARREVHRRRVRDVEDKHGDRANENIARKQLDPYEPRGIALDASFGRSDDAIASEFGRFRARLLSR